MTNYINAMHDYIFWVVHYSACMIKHSVRSTIVINTLMNFNSTSIRRLSLYLDCSQILFCVTCYMLFYKCPFCHKNERLEQRTEQFREQMELQRQSYSSQQSESTDFREILRNKDKEMNAVLDQIEV